MFGLTRGCGKPVPVSSIQQSTCQKTQFGGSEFDHNSNIGRYRMLHIAASVPRLVTEVTLGDERWIRPWSSYFKYGQSSANRGGRWP